MTRTLIFLQYVFDVFRGWCSVLYLTSSAEADTKSLFLLLFFDLAVDFWDALSLTLLFLRVGRKDFQELFIRF